MNTPDWADPTLSADLGTLRSRGEGQSLEYMREFPQQARDLGKEIAGFATSNPGMIILGVSDDGDLVGIPGLDTPAARDELMRRLEGICRGMVKPSITPRVAFAVEDEKVVLIVSVPKGSQPVYYCNHIPYLRHITESRPAEPHEVTDLVLASQARLTAPISLEGGSRREQQRLLASRVAGVIQDVLIFAEELDDRSVNPHLQELRSHFGYAANAARAIAASDDAQEAGLSTELLEFADAAEEVANYRLYLGRQSWDEFAALVHAAAERASSLNGNVVLAVDWPPDTEEWAKRRLREISREVAHLAARAEHLMNEGRTEALQEEASRAGLDILRSLSLGLHDADPEWLRRLREVATQLHLTDTQRLYIDGGASHRALLERIQQSAAALARLAGALDEKEE